MRYMIAVPCHEMVHAEFMRSLMELQRPDDTAFAVVTNTLIYTARNAIAENAVKMGFDRVLWLDSDMVIPSDAMIRLSDDLDEGREIVSGLYFTRKEPITPCIYKELHWKVKPDGWVDTGHEVYKNYYRDDIFEIASCGFGCVMTTVSLLRRMIQKYGAPFYPLMGMGEDNSFCWRVTQDGGTIYCDSRVKCGHVGQYTFCEKDYSEL